MAPKAHKTQTSVREIDGLRTRYLDMALRYRHSNGIVQAMLPKLRTIGTANLAFAERCVSALNEVIDSMIVSLAVPGNVRLHTDYLEQYEEVLFWYEAYFLPVMEAMAFNYTLFDDVEDKTIERGFCLTYLQTVKKIQADCKRITAHQRFQNVLEEADCVTMDGFWASCEIFLERAEKELGNIVPTINRDALRKWDSELNETVMLFCDFMMRCLNRDELPDTNKEDKTISAHQQQVLSEDLPAYRYVVCVLDYRALTSLVTENKRLLDASCSRINHKAFYKQLFQETACLDAFTDSLIRAIAKPDFQITDTELDELEHRFALYETKYRTLIEILQIDTLTLYSENPDRFKRFWIELLKASNAHLNRIELLVSKKQLIPIKSENAEKITVALADIKKSIEENITHDQAVLAKPFHETDLATFYEIRSDRVRLVVRYLHEVVDQLMFGQPLPLPNVLVGVLEEKTVEEKAFRLPGERKAEEADVSEKSFSSALH